MCTLRHTLKWIQVKSLNRVSCLEPHFSPTNFLLPPPFTFLQTSIWQTLPKTISSIWVEIAKISMKNPPTVDIELLPKDLVKRKIVLRGVGSTSSMTTEKVTYCEMMKVIVGSSTTAKKVKLFTTSLGKELSLNRKLRLLITWRNEKRNCLTNMKKGSSSLVVFHLMLCFKSRINSIFSFLLNLNWYIWFTNSDFNFSHG